MDFPDPIDQPARPRPSQPGRADAPRRPAGPSPVPTPDLARQVHSLEASLRRLEASADRHGANQTHLLSVIAGWFICLGVIGVLTVSAVMVSVGTAMWREMRVAGWEDRKGAIGAMLTTWAVILLVLLLPPMLLRMAGFRMFKLRS